ncbi:hypothetical protein Hypma_002953 [Hypsizygus marmoreus]|uniref:Uncharacterized protein n=1 Tax=Hypsizygus marmoreus TaxID=39966 RepID=A0A369J394_HYPMA|nr:hypothetical protein Hypma_002953 [Hypsizygus marmoreus]
MQEREMIYEGEVTSIRPSVYALNDARPSCSSVCLNPWETPTTFLAIPSSHIVSSSPTTLSLSRPPLVKHPFLLFRLPTRFVFFPAYASSPAVFLSGFRLTGTIISTLVLTCPRARSTHRLDRPGMTPGNHAPRHTGRTRPFMISLPFSSFAYSFHVFADVPQSRASVASLGELCRAHGHPMTTASSRNTSTSSSRFQLPASLLFFFSSAQGLFHSDHANTTDSGR